MPIIARFRAIPDNDKAAMVRKLMQNGTPDFDYFYLIGLSTLMATLGLLLNNSSIVIGSMLIAPLMYPLLGIALGFVMLDENSAILIRAVFTLSKSLGVGLALSILAAFFFGSPDLYYTAEIMSRAVPNHLYFLVALVAGAAVSYVMARPEWGDALPGVAISAALIPPLAVIGIGIASLNPELIRGTVMILFLNLVGIVAAAVLVFLLMNLGDKQNIATATIKRETQRLSQQKVAMEKISQELDTKPLINDL